MNGLRERKRAASRQAMSDAATRLFERRGFEQVTLREIADAADVSVKTVLNYFGSKEELFFDAEDGLLENLLAAVRDRPRGTTPTGAVRPLVLDGPMLDVRCPWSVVDDRRLAALRAFHACERGSPALTARRLVITASWAAALSEASGSEGWAAMLGGALVLRHRVLVDGLLAGSSAAELEHAVRTRAGSALDALDRAFPAPA